MERQTIAMLAIALVALAGCIQPEDPQEETEPTPPPSVPTMPAEDCTPPDVESSGGPTGQASVSNQPGSFSYSGQTTAHEGVEVYEWQNPSGGALVAWSGQAVTGELTLTIQDACGEEIYERTIGAGSQGGSSEQTERSLPGSWYITLEFTVFTGQMGLSVNSA